MAELRTFVFTDLVGSVDLKSEMLGASDSERDAAFLDLVLSPHRDRIESFAADFGGRVVSTAGDGHFLVFADVARAARWAIAIQQSHLGDPIATPRGTVAAVRISMHLGTPQIDPRDEENFIGKAVDYAARLNDYAAGGQILISRAARAILEDAGLNGVKFHAHGQRDLKGIGSVEVFELLFDGRAPIDTRRKPREAAPRDWTAHSGTLTYSKVAGLLPDGVAPLSATRVRPSRLGNYELGELIGAGGMGDVFKARHVQFGRLRAVKVIKPHLVTAGQHDVVRRFYQEIKAIGGLEHPNIVVAIDSSSPDDLTHYLVMEYVNGVSAGELVDRFGALSVANACEIARQTALGLDCIDRRGMVHRDIKPSNLMVTIVETPHLSTDSPATSGALTSQPLIKILDLGLALLVGDDHERLTRLDHRAMGTAMYMSPEQWRTTSVDIRSDIYSLGCTLYHLLSGQPPFFESDLRPERAHQKGRVPPIKSRLIPKPLWHVLRTAMAKAPEERYESPAAFAEALAPFAVGNTLVEVVEEARKPLGSEPTMPGHASDTYAGAGPQSDTHLAGPRAGSSLTGSPTASRRWLLAAGVIAALSLAAGAWFATEAARRWTDLEESRARLETARRDSFVSAARLRAGQVASEVELRFRILSNAAKSDLLQTDLAAVSAAPQDEALWRPLQSWIDGEKESHDAEAPSESWFIVAADGTQVARAPSSTKSIGNNYAHRDYFHGQGADLPEDTTGVKPIEEINQSAVYRSTTTGKLKVAFSVPVGNGKKLQAERAIAGVLAMSVDLGDFAILEQQLPPGQRQFTSEKEVLLIDLRPDYIEQGPSGESIEKRGLILHHQDLPDRGPGEAPARLPAELLERIDRALAAGERVLVDYPDPLGLTERRYWGAIEPVVINRRSESPINTHWLVLVQERLEK